MTFPGRKSNKMECSHLINWHCTVLDFHTMLFTGLGSTNIVSCLLQYKSDIRQEENLKQYILLSSIRISSIQVLFLRLLYHIQYKELKSIAKFFFILV